MKPWDYFGGKATVIWAVLLCIYWGAESIVALFMRAGRRRKDQDQVRDRGSLRWIAVLFPLSWWGAIIASFVLRKFSFSTPGIFTAGVAIMVAGQLLRWWSIATLGRLFTINVAIREGHRVIDQGPYRFVRHPSYTAILLFHVGSALCLGNWVSAIVLVLPPAIALLHRMRVEEDALLGGLGSDYGAYMKRTKRLVPGVY